VSNLISGSRAVQRTYRESLPVQAEIPYEISGPMGRATLILPCQHRRAWAPDPVTSPGPVTRTCPHCRTRYSIAIGEKTAQVIRLN
jgi:hypothetical protein